MTQPLILVAEDEAIIGYDLCETVGEAGFAVEGPHTDMTSAMLACQKTRPAAAILDIQLDDGIVFPLAEKLMAEDIPVIFHSGIWSPEEMQEKFPQTQTLAKPCPPDRMIETVQKAVGNA
ncbi:response regulator [Parapontixanthobacter aurantiacus]|uniref:response regulator n=1 Tax=Parapontixanthobacter aurantiacus TaxID=1463599 RepID=UPI0019282238|nr:response regulator [Parapontixanthobacter aurantiacus]